MGRNQPTHEYEVRVFGLREKCVQMPRKELASLMNLKKASMR